MTNRELKKVLRETAAASFDKGGKQIKPAPIKTPSFCEQPLKKGRSAANTEQLKEKIIGELAARGTREHQGYFGFLILQIKFIGLRIWGFQGGLFLLLGSLLSAAMGEHFLENPRYAPLLLCCLSLCVLMSALPFLLRCERYKMCEVEAAARTSRLKLLFARLIIIAAGDIAMLGGILALTLIKSALAPSVAAFCLLVPFLTAACGILFIIGAYPLSRIVFGGSAVCLFTGAGFYLLIKIYPAIIGAGLGALRVGLCLAALVLCGGALRYISVGESYV
ncbi:MAG: hypothetical protein GX061_02710 [Eubacteriaceae bacterium]|nr:hypothetical protein [Eubacteriaceae bacterium]